MFRKTFYLYITIVCFVFVHHGRLISTCIADSNSPYKEGEIIVRFAPKANGIQRTTSERNQVLAALNAGEIERSVKLVPGLSLVKLPANLTVTDAISTLKGKSEFLYVEPNYKIRMLSTTPNDPRFTSGEQWGLHNTGQRGTADADIDAPEAWDFRHDASDLIVAVIDTGVDYTHPDLAANMWVNTGEIPGNGIDDDDNNSVDDIYGYDFCTYGGHVRNSNPMDDFGHGTHCAGIIGAVGNNNTGITGICWNVKIMALKFINFEGYGWSYDAIDCIDYAVLMGAKVLSNSWGYRIGNPYFTDVQALKDAIEAAGAAGILVVAAAGNDNANVDNYTMFRNYPASYDCSNIISVMATDANDQRAIWQDEASNWGQNLVDLAAPGSNILSCWRYNTCPYLYSSGTSMSAPFVAGACALVWSRNLMLSHLQVKDVIMNSVDQLSSLSGKCVTEGRLNLYNAVAGAPALGLTNVDNIAEGRKVNPGQQVTYTISYRNPNVSEPNYLGTVYDANITAYLPEEVNYASVTGPNAVHDIFDDTVNWNIGTLSPSESGSVTVTVNVNYLAEPLGRITNRCVMRGSSAWSSIARITDVNTWSPAVIYVDVNAPGATTGMSWNNAYRDLQYALGKVRQGCGNAIWVAKGRYKPTTDPVNYEATFQLVSGKLLYGGFAGGETNINQRNLSANETILDGDIDGDGYADLDYVVTADTVNSSTVIDGFTVRKGYYEYGDSAGIYISGGSPTIKHAKITENKYGIHCVNSSSPNITNCLIENNSSSYGGIYCNHSTLNLSNSLIKNNGSNGIYCYNSSTLNMNNSIVRNNTDSGVYCNTSSPVIKNSLICNNGNNGSDGIFLVDCSNTLVRDNTITDNGGYGIFAYDGSLNVTNCIVWGNNYGSLESSGWNVTYSCIEGGYAGQGNKNINPQFITDDPYYHIGSTSPCIDAGNDSYADENDIDGESRMMDGDNNGSIIVDMGADEYYQSKADYNRDNVVNSIDYCTFANAWKTTNTQVSLDSDNDVDYLDLRLFCKDWLWQPGWLQEIGEGWLMMGLGGGDSMMAQGQSVISIAAFAESAEQAVVEQTVSPETIEEMVNWLDEIWNAGDLNGTMTEQEYLEFRQAIESTLEPQ